METYMTDEEALELLRLLYRYVRYAGDQPSEDIRISELASDLALSDESGLDEVQDLNSQIRECVL